MFESWAEFFELSKDIGPTALLENAVRLLVKRDQALDLGAGSLKDSKFMLSMGIKKVTAIDSDPAIRKYHSKIPTSQLLVKVAPFEGLKLKPNTYDFISAQHALYFSDPDYFPTLIEQIIGSLKPCGIFCAQFLGPKDSWNTTDNNLTFITKAELKKLLAPLDLVFFQEEIREGTTIDQQTKVWHLFHVIALKPALKPKKAKKKIKKAKK